MAKTSAGRIRIAAASDRLTRTAADLGQQWRDDLPQGENVGMAQVPPSEIAPELVPIDESSLRREVDYREPSHLHDDDASRVVLPPADEAGGAETQVPWAFVPQERAEPGMVVDVVDTDEELRELMAVLTRDAKKEIAEHDDEIMPMV